MELVIESGMLSAEHVEHVLACLNAAPPPASAVANTGRYDSLRATVTTASLRSTIRPRMELRGVALGRRNVLFAALRIFVAS